MPTVGCAPASPTPPTLGKRSHVKNDMDDAPVRHARKSIARLAQTSSTLSRVSRRLRSGKRWLTHICVRMWSCPGQATTRKNIKKQKQLFRLLKRKLFQVDCRDWLRRGEATRAHAGRWRRMGHFCWKAASRYLTWMVLKRPRHKQFIFVCCWRPFLTLVGRLLGGLTPKQTSLSRTAM